ncbi:hypothetical protein [Parvibaculum sp.]|uniref:hypothetical protein n=1 Tax=Parvibaculum sp. TaxID=2024848 RepID=UPI00391AD854
MNGADENRRFRGQCRSAEDEKQSCSGEARMQRRAGRRAMMQARAEDAVPLQGRMPDFAARHPHCRMAGKHRWGNNRARNRARRRKQPADLFCTAPDPGRRHELFVMCDSARKMTQTGV